MGFEKVETEDASTTESSFKRVDTVGYVPYNADDLLADFKGQKIDGVKSLNLLSNESSSREYKKSLFSEGREQQLKTLKTGGKLAGQSIAGIGKSLTAGTMQFLGDQLQVNSKVEKLATEFKGDNDLINKAKVGVHFKNRAGEFLSNTGELYEKIFDVADEVPLFKLGEREQEVFEGSFIENPSWERAQANVIGGVPSLFGAFGAFKLLNSADKAMLLVSGVDASESYLGAKKAGKETEEAQAILGATFAGTYALERFGILSMFDNKSMKEVKNSLFNNMIQGATREGITEGMQTSWQNLVAKVGYDDSRGVFDGFWDSMIAGTGLGAGAGAFAPRIPYQEFIRNELSGDNKKEVEEFVNAISDSVSENPESVDDIFKEHFDKSLKAWEELSKDPEFMAEMFNTKESITRDVIEKGGTKEEAESIGVMVDKIGQVAETVGIPIKDWFNENALPEIKRDSFNEKGELLSPTREILFQDPTTYNEQGQVKTESPEFKNWFGDSKVVDAKGEPLVVYHGTNEIFEAFDKGKISRGELGYGLNFTSYKPTAKKFGSNIIDVYLDIKKPFIMSWDNSSEAIEVLREYQKISGLDKKLLTKGDFLDLGYNVIQEEGFNDFLKNKGYDGIINKSVQLTAGPGVSYIAFEPTQIKSVDNKGTFDPTDPNIFRQDTIKKQRFEKAEKEIGKAVKDNSKNLEEYKETPEYKDIKREYDIAQKEYTNEIRQGRLEQDARGFYDVRENTIYLLKTADRTTLLHEFSHFFMQQLIKLNNISVSKTGESLGLYDDLTSVIGEPENGIFTREQNEDFAKQFETFVMKGEVENTKLKPVFRKLAMWFRETYDSFKQEMSSQADKLFNDIMDSPYINEQVFYQESLDKVADIQEKVNKGESITLEELESIKVIRDYLKNLKKTKPKQEQDFLQYIRQQGAYNLDKMKGLDIDASLQDTVAYKGLLNNKSQRNEKDLVEDYMSFTGETLPIDSTFEQESEMMDRAIEYLQDAIAKPESTSPNFEDINAIEDEIAQIETKTGINLNNIDEQLRTAEESISKEIQVEAKKTKKPLKELLEARKDKLKVEGGKQQDIIKQESLNRLVEKQKFLNENMDDYLSESQTDNRLFTTMKNSSKDLGNSLGEFSKDTFLTDDSVFMDLSPELFKANRKFLASQFLENKADKDIVMPFVDKFTKLPEEDYLKLDIALKNRDKFNVEEMVNKYDMKDEYYAVVDLLADIRDQSIDVGYDIGYLQDYFPRVIRDTNELLDFIETKKGNNKSYNKITKEIERIEAEKNISLTQEDKAKIANNMLRGFSGGLTLGSTSSMKERKLELITPDLSQFYNKSTDALINYVSNSRKSIQQRKFLGIDGKDINKERAKLKDRKIKLAEIENLSPASVKAKERTRIDFEIAGLEAKLKNISDELEIEIAQAKLEDLTDIRSIYTFAKPELAKGFVVKRRKAEIESIKQKIEAMDKGIIEQGIGKIIVELSKDLNQKQLEIVKKQLEGSFKEGNVPSIFQANKNISYAMILGNPINAITQFGDLAFSAYNSGVYSTISTAFNRKSITVDDIGLENLTLEMDTGGVSSQILQKTFKLGFSQVDKLGKTTLMNSFIKKTKSDLKSNLDTKKTKMVDFYFENADKVKQDIMNDVKSKEVLELAILNLMDFQPISKAQVPLGYKTNFKLLYTLQTYSVQAINVARREALGDISKGEARGDKGQVVRGLQNLTKLAFLLMLFNAGTDMLKDLLLGRDIEVSETLLENLILGGVLNKYQFMTLEREGFSGVAGDILSIPFPIADAVFEAIQGDWDKATDKWLLLKYIKGYW